MDQRLTVLHLIETGGPGGAETVLRSLVSGTPRRPWNLHVVIPETGWLHDGLVADGRWPARVIGFHRMGRVEALRTLRRTIRKLRPHVIHAHLLGSGFYASLASFGTGIPTICTIHGMPDLGLGRFNAGVKLRVVGRSNNRVVFVSESLRHQVVEQCGMPTGFGQVIANGISLEPPPPGLREWRTEMGVRPTEFLVGAIGNLRPAKDYPTLIRALALLRARGVPARLAILGEGPPSAVEELNRTANELDVLDAVSLPGFSSDTAGFLEAADVYATSSSTEGFSLSTVEALWHRCPVVATRSGGPEEILDEGRLGLLVPVGAPGSLADALHRVWLDRPEAVRRAAIGQLEVERRYGIDRMVHEYEGLYREIAGLPPSISSGRPRPDAPLEP